ncbi:MAG: hypothetical protein HOC09_01320 [Deltaproteobacteria bacterium]|nr:hypothetical protein [Deltaproteobacteria bacterium]
MDRNIDEMVAMMLGARKQGEPIPVLSQHFPELTRDTAYAVQKAVIEAGLADDDIAGYKMGASSDEQQKSMGLNEPAAGVLLASGKRTGSPVIPISDFKLPFIETEIALVIGEVISEPPADVAGFRSLCRGFMPAVELADPAFPDGTAPGGVDMLAANVIAKQYILGEERPHIGTDVNQIEVTLSFNGSEINRGRGNDALGDQWAAGFWLVRTMLKQGWRFEPGHIIMTGLLGNLALGQPGRYEADYGSAGCISFDIE